MIKNISYSLLLILLNISLCEKSFTDIQNEIKSNNQLLDNLEVAIEKLEKDINSMESSKKSLSDNVDMINQKIEYREKQIALLIQQDKHISDLINNSSKKIKRKDVELDTLKSKLKQRSIHIFKHGKENILSKLIISKNWNQSLNRLKYLEILLEYEKKLNLKIQTNIKELTIEKQQLRKDKKNQKTILNEAENIYKKLEKDKKNKLQKIKQIENDKSELAENLNTKKKKLSDIENIIQQLVSDSKEAKKREKILAKERAKQNKATSGNFAKMKGKLEWPSRGKIITKFGKKTDPKLNTITEENGINIKTNKNAPVYSVLDGDVAIVNFQRRVGNYIIIRHGEGYFTVYANIKNIIVREGDYIGSNIQIANVSDESNDPNISNTHYLHFEIWKNELKLNPELWINKN